MSNIPISEGNRADLQDRRAHPRQPLRSLAYLDLDDDNGGIILNLSRDGLGFRAVAPLEFSGNIRLTIQLPSSFDQIDAVAQVAWLSEAKRLGGLRFIEISEAAASAIEQWVSWQTSWTPSRDKLTPPSKTARELRPLKPRLVEAPREPRGLEPNLNPKPIESARLDKPRREDPVFEQGNSEELLAVTKNLPDTSQARQAPLPEAKSGDTPPDPAAISSASPVRSKRGPAAEDNLLTGPVRNTAAISLSHLAASIKRLQTPSKNRAVRGTAALFVAVAFLVLLFFAIKMRSETSQAVRGTSTELATAAPAVDDEASATNSKDNSRHAISSYDKRSKAKLRRVPSEDPEASAAQPIEPRDEVSLSSVTTSVETSDSPNVSTSPPVLQDTTAAKPPPIDDSAAASPTRIVDGLTLKPSDRFNPCHLTYRVEPNYPDEAKNQHVEGVVKIRQKIGPDGNVIEVKIVSGPPLLIESALDAARYWRYLPALLNGKPIETQKDIEIEFHLPN